MKKQSLIKLEQLAKKACDLGKRNIGRGWESLDGQIKVYTAENSNHQSLQYKGIKVSLFNPAEFTFSIRHFDTFDETVEEIEKGIESYEKELAEQGEKKRKEAIEAKRRFLKQQLDELGENE